MNPVTLETPIQRGEQKIESIELRKPKVGELRGLSIAELLQMDVSAHIKLLPRISDPTLTEPEAASLDPADLTALASVVVGFFLPKSAQD